jgi:ABC-type transport system substrate-binding protein
MLRLTALTGAGLIAARCVVPAPTQEAAPAAPTAAPTAAPPAAAPMAGGELVVGTVGDLANMDPFFMNFNNYPMMQSVYDQFVHLDNEVKPHPSVIEEWTPSPDGLTLTLKVRSGVKYHDGSTATAEDVTKCIMRAANSETGGHQYASWRGVKEATAKGSDVVEVVLSEVAAYILPAMGFISLIRPGAFDGLASAEGGSGPFKVKEWVPNDYLDMEKFADYWDAGRPKVDNVRLKFFADPTAMVSALEAGTIDLALSVPPTDYERLQGQGINIMRGQDAANFYYFAMNARKPPFDNKAVRQAIAFAIDKATMCKNVLFGVSEPIELAWPKFSFAYFPEFEGMYRYDLEEAKRRLTEAGYPDGIEFNLEYATSYPEFGQFAEILKASLAEIGSTLNIVPMDPAQYTPLVFEGEGYQTTFSFAGGTQWYPTRISLSSLYRLENNVCWPDGKPPAGWVEGIKKADTSLDPEVQKEGMKQVVETMMDEMWSMPIAFRYTLFGMQDYVEGFSYGVYDQPHFYDVTLNK